MSFNLACFLVRSGGHTIAVDTGMGPRPADAPETPWGDLLNDFQANGVKPEDVDMVVMTHLHRDHVGWNLQQEAGKFAPTFPNAKYYVRRDGRHGIHRWHRCPDDQASGPGGHHRLRHPG